VLRARREPGPEFAAALEELCRTCGFPICAYVRRHVSDPENAKGFTQEFFARLIEHNLVGLAHPQRGKLRAYVLTLLKHFLANRWERKRAQKRGGGTPAECGAAASGSLFLAAGLGPGHPAPPAPERAGPPAVRLVAG
jgi:RNA polymerase sigma-70 factor (ECF subfamily)